MVVVADTSPINYLILIGEIGVLQQVYQCVAIPEEVFSELMDTESPPEVCEWLAPHTAWIEIRKSPSRDAALSDLDAGEAAAVALPALETDVLLLIDESAGRLEASRRGIPNTGMLGVLRRAGIEHLADLRAALNRLPATNFRVSKPLVADLLAEAADRKRQGD
jgi:predicted nucleic acid-binding protein